MEKIFIKNRKSQNISVIIDKHENSEGVAFVMHGLGGSKEQPHVQAFANAFKEKEYTVILFDTTNSLGESDGNYENMTTTNYYEDLEDIIKWAELQEWYKEPFILSGHSLGGLCVAYYAENFPEKVLAIAPISLVVSGKLNIEADMKYKPEEFEKWKETGWKTRKSNSKPGLIIRLPWSHVKDKLKYDLFPKIENLTMPVLLIVGENDIATPVEHVKKFFESLSGPKEFHIIKGARHVFRDSQHLEEIKRIFLAWIDKI